MTRNLTALAWVMSLASLSGQTEPSFIQVLRQTNGEVNLTLQVTPDAYYRVDVAADPTLWQPWVTARSSGVNVHLDGGAVYQGGRFYRAVQLPGPALAGDHLSVEGGDLLIHPINHATFVMRWNDLMIYNDPVGGTAPFQGLAPANLVLVGHSHGDHFSASTLGSVLAPGALIVAPQAVYNGLSAALRAQTIVLANGASTNVLGLTVQAVPAYNLTTTFHTKGTGNGYVLSVGGKRVYISGDTEDVPEMRALASIDVAFLCINQPFTMTVAKAADAVRAFRPRVVYPYHFRNQDGTFSNLDLFKATVGFDVGVEVRVRPWY